MNIRLLTDKEILQASQLVERVFMEFEAPDYPEQGIRHFLDFISPSSLSSMLHEGSLRLWGNYEKKALTGVSALRGESHISLLFVEKAWQQKGIASALMDVMMAACPTETMTVNSSPYAVAIYKRLGFQPVGPMKIDDGILYTPMECRLPSRRSPSACAIDTQTNLSGIDSEKTAASETED